MFKPVAERVLVHSGLAWLWSRWPRRQCLILAYHNVVPDDERGAGDASLHLSLSEFVAQIDSLRRTHTIVSLRDFPSIQVRGPTAIITFDDAYRGALEIALPVLRDRQISATVFVAPGILGNRYLWWDALATDGQLSATTREYVLDTLKGSDAMAAEWARDSWKGTASSWYRTSTDEAIVAYARDPLISIGCHSWSHPNLTRLSDASLTEEMSRPMRWLRERAGPAFVPWVAYPYGLFDARVEAAARAAGYLGAAAISGGWADPQASFFTRPRLNIPAGLSHAGFRLRASGLISR